METDALPDPNGEPQGDKGDFFGTAIWLSFAAVVALGVVVGPSMFSRGACRGASRSSRVKWEERQAEIEQTISTQNNEANQVSIPQR